MICKQIGCKARSVKESQGMVSYVHLSTQYGVSRPDFIEDPRLCRDFTFHASRSTIRWSNRTPSRVRIVGDGAYPRRIVSDGEQ